MSQLTSVLHSLPISAAVAQWGLHVRKFAVPGVAALTGVAAIFLILYGLFAPASTSVVLTQAGTELPADTLPQESAAETPQVIVVDVSGAVKKPGLYSVQTGSRVGDAVAAAGGISELADRQTVAENINLAEKLQDGQKVFIPVHGSVASQATPAGSSTESGTAKISISTASQQELESLEGVGEKRAQAIIAGRPYQSLSELVERKILSASLYTEIEADIQL